VRFNDLIGGTHQIDMFEDIQETIKLHQAMDSIKSQYGEKYLMRAAGCMQHKIRH